MAKAKKIDWLNHGLEFIVVFIGILIAFQLNKFSENRSKSKLIDNHFRYIKEECKENIKRLHDGIIHTSAQLSKADSLLAAIRAKKNSAQVKRLSTSLLDLGKVNLKNDAQRVLTESGDIRFIKNFEKKKEVITLYESFSSVKGIDENVLKIYDNYYYPYLKDNFDLLNWGANDAVDEKEKEKYYSKEFGNIISTYRYLLESKLKSYTDCKNELEAFLKKSKN